MAETPQPKKHKAKSGSPKKDVVKEPTGSTYGFLDKLENQVPTEAARAVKRAYNKALIAGHKVLIVEGDRLVQVDSKNKRTFVHKVQPSVKIAKGTTYKLK